MIEEICLLRDVGAFQYTDTGPQFPLSRFALIYAENGRGKTTLAAILRSLSNGDPIPIIERTRLGSSSTPHVAIKGESTLTAVFQDGTWTNRFGDIAVFDDQFVSDNVCSGMLVAVSHRQNLHELIIGAQGVTLNNQVQAHIERVEQHIRELQARSIAISADVRGPYAVEAFCRLEKQEDLSIAIKNAERSLAAARDADAVRTQGHFLPLSLPTFDLDSITDLLSRGLPNLETDAAGRVKDHLSRLGDRGESWIGSGMERIESASAGQDRSICPFCAQELNSSELITHYQAYFSDAYRELNQSIAECSRTLKNIHSGEAQAAFEREVRVIAETREFWALYVDLPEFSADTAALARAWKEAFEAITRVLTAKQAAPLEPHELEETALRKVAAYSAEQAEVNRLSQSLVSKNPEIDLVKENAAEADIAVLENDLAKLKAMERRHQPDIAAVCDAYIVERNLKAETERLRDAARAALNQYRDDIFPQYEDAINHYLQKLNANFRLESVASVNNRSGSSCNYSVLINEVAVPLSTSNEGEQAFHNTLSAGDRNALALAFFFASLDLDPNKNRKTVVIDDPMTSLDEHRSLATIQAMQLLCKNVSQIIVLSHSKTFLCNLWLDSDESQRSAVKIARTDTGSTLACWDVNQDCITEHDKRHELVCSYINNSVDIDERTVAIALRPILEAFMRVAYPQHFKPGDMLGRFYGKCLQKEGSTEEILSPTDREELKALMSYANQFHHDSNAATYLTTAINDQELLDFANRTIAMSRK